MKHSDSTNSLTHLQEVNEATCCFCHEPEDLEKALALIHSKQFSGCGCVFSSHLQCWKTYLEQTEESKALCPLCKESIATLSRIRAELSPFTATRPYQSMRNIQWTLCGFFVISIVVVAFLCIYIYGIPR